MCGTNLTATNANVLGTEMIVFKGLDFSFSRESFHLKTFLPFRINRLYEHFWALRSSRKEKIKILKRSFNFMTMQAWST